MYILTIALLVTMAFSIQSNATKDAKVPTKNTIAKTHLASTNAFPDDDEEETKAPLSPWEAILYLCLGWNK